MKTNTLANEAIQYSTWNKKDLLGSVFQPHNKVCASTV